MKLKLRPRRLDLELHPGNAESLRFRWPTDLGARTFTATVENEPLAVDVAGTDVVVAFTEAQTAALPGVGWWRLTETTGGITKDRIVGSATSAEGGTSGAQQDTVTVLVDEVAVSVTVLGDPGTPGASAYEVAVGEGFAGTEADWLASLVGPQGDPGPAGAGYVHAQSTPSAVWTVQHGLGYRPGGITVLDADGDLILGWTAVHASDAVLVLTFPQAESGTAYIS